MLLSAQALWRFCKGNFRKNKSITIDVGKEIDPNTVKKVKQSLPIIQKIKQEREIINLSKKLISLRKTLSIQIFVMKISVITNQITIYIILMLWWIFKCLGVVSLPYR